MSVDTIYCPHDVVASIQYWPEGRPGNLAGEENASNSAYGARANDAREMKIHDVRATGGDFTLDENGFQILVLPHAPRYTKNDQEIEAEQYPELVEALKNITGGSRVRIFNHVVRDNVDSRTELEKLRYDIVDNSSTYPRVPATRPHTDFHAGTCSSIFSDTHPLMAQHIVSGKRWQILGVWRPLQIVQRNPLAVCDARTMRGEVELEKAEREVRGKPRVYCVLKAGDRLKPAHRWYYLPDQRPDEAWVIKHFDSLEEVGIARQLAHTSFELPGTTDLPPRESAEFRALVFYD